MYLKTKRGNKEREVRRASHPLRRLGQQFLSSQLNPLSPVLVHPTQISATECTQRYYKRLEVVFTILRNTAKLQFKTKLASTQLYFPLNYY